MGWIDQASASIDGFKSLQRLLKVLGELNTGGNLEQTSQKIDDLVDGYLANNNGAEADELNGIFDRVDLFGAEDGQLTGFIDDWKLLRSSLDSKYVDYLKAMMSPLSNLRSVNDPDLKIIWPLLNSDGDVGHGFDDVKLSLSADLEAQLSIAVENEPGTLQQAEIIYGLNGKLGAELDIGIPIKYGSVGINSGWLGSCACRFHRIHDSAAELGESLKRDLTQMKSPFQLDTAAALVLSETGFNEVVLQRSGDWLLGGNLTLGVEKFGDSLVAAEAGLNVELEKKWQRALDVSLRPSANNHLVLEIKDTKADTLSFDGSLGLDIVGRWQQPIIEKVDEHLADVKEIVEHVKEFKDLGTYLKTKVLEALEDSPWESIRVLLKGLLDSDADVDAVLTELLLRIEEDAAKILNPWQTGLSKFGHGIIDALSTRWPKIANKADELKDHLDKALDNAFDTAKQNLRNRLTEIAQNDVKFQQWVEKLKAVQIKIANLESDVNEKANQLFTGILQLLDRYQGVLQKIKQKLADATTIDLGLQWQRQWQETDGEVVLLSFEFDPSHVAAAEFYKKGLLGNLKLLQAKSDDPESWSTNGIRCVSGLFKRYLSTQREDGFKLSFLKFNLQEVSILDIRTEITSDLSGNVTVRTRLQQSDESSFGSTTREIELLNAFSLNQAKDSRDINLSLTLSHAEEDLSIGDIDDMMGGLVKAGRISPESLSRAKSLLNSMATKDAEIHLALNMQRDHLLQLLRIAPNEISTAKRELTKKQKQQIQRIIAEECIEHGSAADHTKRLKRFYNRGGIPENLLQALLTISSQKVDGIVKVLDRNPGILDSQIRNMTPELKRIARTHDAILDLTRAINTMRQIFLAPVSSSREHFQQLQKEQAKYLSEWIQVDGVIARLLSGGELRSRTVVLIESIFRLSGMEQSLQVVIKNSETGEVHVV